MNRSRPLVGAALTGTLVAGLWSAAVATAADDLWVFSVLEDGGWRLYSQAGAAAPQPVPTPGVRGDQLAPRLSPDGRQVAFEVTGRGLYVCPLAPAGGDAAAPGCAHLPITDGQPVRPVWHPDGDQLFYVQFEVTAGEERSDLAAVSADLTRPRPVLSQSGIQDFLDISPDGRRLAYTSWQTVMPVRAGVQVIQQLWVLDLARGVAGQLLLGNASEIHPRWSPDGRALAFASNRGGRYEIWRVGADGGNLRQLTDGPGDKTWPVWSPDGRRVLFTWEQAGRSGFGLVSADGSGPDAWLPFGPGADRQLRDADWRRGATSVSSPPE